MKVELFYSPAIEYSHKFINSLEDVYHKIKDRILFEPHVVTFTSQSQEFIAKNCVSSGAYCAFDPSHASSATGKDVVLESLRQKCVYKSSISNYFAYMKGFYTKCFDSFSESCSKSVAEKNWIDWIQIKDCVNKSFLGPDKNMLNNDNEILSVEKDKMKKLGTNNFPNIYINNILYKGSLSKLDILLSICSTLHDDVYECRNIDMVPYDDVGFWQLVLIQAIVFITGTVFLALVCRRIAKRQYLRFFK